MPRHKCFVWLRVEEWKSGRVEEQARFVSDGTSEHCFATKHRWRACLCTPAIVVVVVVGGGCLWSARCLRPRRCLCIGCGGVRVRPFFPPSHCALARDSVEACRMEAGGSLCRDWMRQQGECGTVDCSPARVCWRWTWWWWWAKVSCTDRVCIVRMGRLHKHRVLLLLSVDLTNNAFNTVQRPAIASQGCV